MQNKIERITSMALTVSALAIAGSLVKREFFADPASRIGPDRNAKPVKEKDWKTILPWGVRIGKPDAPVTIVEFADLECPFCKRFHESSLAAVQKEYGASVSIVYVHFPIPAHRFARTAAQAAECANAQGAFAEFVNTIYRKQDSLGLKSWSSYASDAGVRDTAVFARCVSARTPVASIDSGLAIGQRFHIQGTPTVLVNGWRFAAPPTDTTLTRFINALLEGRPVS
jgi:protein-disulfide isomerase